MVRPPSVLLRTITAGTRAHAASVNMTKLQTIHEHSLRAGCINVSRELDRDYMQNKKKHLKLFQTSSTARRKSTCSQRVTTARLQQ